MNTPPNNKNYLRCLLFGGAFSIRGKGLYTMYIYIHIQPLLSQSQLKKGYETSGRPNHQLSMEGASSADDQRDPLPS